MTLTQRTPTTEEERLAQDVQRNAEIARRAMSLTQQVDNIWTNYESDIAGLRNWKTLEELHAIAVPRRQQALASIVTLLAPTPPPLSCSSCTGGPVSYCRACFEGRRTTPTPLRREDLVKALIDRLGTMTPPLGGWPIKELADVGMAWAAHGHPMTQPDREGLEKILRFDQYHDKQFAEQLLAWATPTPLRKEALESIVGQAIGEASLQWIPRPAGVFDASEASKVAQRTTETIWAWLHGPQEATPLPVWCRHLLASSNNSEYVFEDHSGFENCRLVRTTEWNSCPICAAPRPGRTP